MDGAGHIAPVSQYPEQKKEIVNLAQLPVQHCTDSWVHPSVLPVGLGVLPEIIPVNKGDSGVGKSRAVGESVIGMIGPYIRPLVAESAAKRFEERRGTLHECEKRGGV